MKAPANLTMLVLLFLSLGCYYTMRDLDEHLVESAYVARHWLPPLVEGQTLRAALLERLGAPSHAYENDRILVWRLLLSEPSLDRRQYLKLMGMTPGQSFVSGPYYNLENDFSSTIPRHNRHRQQLDEHPAPLVIHPGEEESHLWPILGREAEYSLVAVFDAQATLTTHSLVRIYP